MRYHVAGFTHPNYLALVIVTNEYQEWDQFFLTIDYY